MVLIFGNDRTMPSSQRRRRTRACAALGVLLVVGGAVGTGCSSIPHGSGTTADPLHVVASFYPLQWMAQQVGGRRVDVRSLTKPGAEPHDLELTPSDVAAVQDADAVVYLSGFQPSVDTAIDGRGKDAVFDARAAAHLDLSFTPIEDGQAAPDQTGATDPHFWLDPIRLGRVGAAFGETLAHRDPAHAKDYRRNAQLLKLKLAQLDLEFHNGLAHCASTDVITSHNAFGYLGRRYGLHQVGITGLTPDDEPSPKDLAAVADFVERHHVRTIYFETLVSPSIARAVADETGARTAVLDPIEGLSHRSQGRDYLAIMRANLKDLQAGQSCTVPKDQEGGR